MVAGVSVELYKTERVSFIWPKRIELAHRTIRRYRPDLIGYIQDFSPFGHSSLGMSLMEDGDNLVLRGNVLRRVPSGNTLEISVRARNRTETKMAILTFIQTLDKYKENLYKS